MASATTSVRSATDRPSAAAAVRPAASDRLGEPGDPVRRAAYRQHWRETYVGTVVGDRVLEGFIDLVYENDDGLVIVGHKTDTVPAIALDRRVTFYRPQIAPT